MVFTVRILCIRDAGGRRQARTHKPEPPGCLEELAKVKRILEQQQSVKKSFAQKERALT